MTTAPSPSGGLVARFTRVVDRAAPRTTSSPDEQFQLRFLVGGALLGLLVALISFASELYVGATISLTMISGFGVAMIGLVAAVRAGVAVPILTWGTVVVLGLFLVGQSLIYDRLLPEQLPWLVLLPQVSLVMVGPRIKTSETPSSRRPVAVATALAIGLGGLIILAHAHGVTFGEPAPTPSHGLQFAAFLPFVLAVAGMMWLYDLALRATEAELRALRRLLSVCAWCKKIHDDDDGWIELERYIAKRDAPALTHGICPTCERDQFASGG